MKKVTPILIAALLLSGCSRNQSASVTSPASVSLGAIVWGQSVEDLQAGLSLGGKTKDSTVIVFHIRNVGDGPIRILKLSSQARFWGQYLPVEVSRSGSVQEYRGPCPDPPPPPHESEYITLDPGEYDSVEASFLPNLWGLVVPFEANVVFIMRCPPEDVKGLWTGVVRSGALAISRSS
jgi:hypothetical protein